MDTPINIAEMDWVRLSAYLDGEGYIGIASKDKGKRAHHLTVPVGNVDPRLTTWLLKTFGGTIAECKFKARKKRFWVWRVYGHQAAELLKKCLPFFIMKRDQAEVAIAFQELIGSPRSKGIGGAKSQLTNEVEDKRAALMFKLREVRENSAEKVSA